MLVEQKDVKCIHSPPPTEGRMLTMAGLFDVWKPPLDGVSNFMLHWGTRSPLVIVHRSIGKSQLHGIPD